MAKRFGFTLAEVLITLGIIGVIAALVIPALNNKIQDAEFRSAYKKTFSILSEATKQAQADNGSILFSTLAPQGCPYRELETLRPYLKMSTYCSDGALTAGVCWHNDSNWFDYNGNQLSMSNFSYSSDSNYGQAGILENGTMIKFHSPACGGGNISYDGYKLAGILVDINGFKGPNILGKDIQNISIASRVNPTISKDNYALIPGHNFMNIPDGCSQNVIGYVPGLNCGKAIMQGEDY